MDNFDYCCILNFKDQQMQINVLENECELLSLLSCYLKSKNKVKLISKIVSSLNTELTVQLKLNNDNWITLIKTQN